MSHEVGITPKKIRAIELRATGYSIDDIARELGKSTRTIVRWLEKHRSSNAGKDIIKQGKQRAKNMVNKGLDVFDDTLDGKNFANVRDQIDVATKVLVTYGIISKQQGDNIINNLQITDQERLNKLGQGLGQFGVQVDITNNRLAKATTTEKPPQAPPDEPDE